MIADLTYDQASSHIERVLTGGKALKADVYISHSSGRRFIVKDFGRKGFLERNLVGRIVISRELRAYRSLAGLNGIASEYKRLSPFSIAIQYLEGRDLGGIDRGGIGPGVIEQLDAVIKALHERGWVHLDLQRRTNILLVKDRVFVIDLASAFHPGAIPLIGRTITRLMGLADRMSLIKMKNIFAPELITPQEQRWLKLRNLVMPRKW